MDLSRRILKAPCPADILINGNIIIAVSPVLDLHVIPVGSRKSQLGIHCHIKAHLIRRAAIAVLPHDLSRIIVKLRNDSGKDEQDQKDDDQRHSAHRGSHPEKRPADRTVHTLCKLIPACALLSFLSRLCRFALARIRSKVQCVALLPLEKILADRLMFLNLLLYHLPFLLSEFLFPVEFQQFTISHIRSPPLSCAVPSSHACSGSSHFHKIFP